MSITGFSFPTAIRFGAGALADSIGVQSAYVLPLLCYVFIVYYGFFGARVVDAPAGSTQSTTLTAPH